MVCFVIFGTLFSQLYLSCSGSAFSLGDRTRPHKSADTDVYEAMPPFPHRHTTRGDNSLMTCILLTRKGNTATTSEENETPTEQERDKYRSEYLSLRLPIRIGRCNHLGHRPSCFLGRCCEAREAKFRRQSKGFAYSVRSISPTPLLDVPRVLMFLTDLISTTTLRFTVYSAIRRRK